MKNLVSYSLAVIASMTMALTTGCVSGGFKLTRQYAGWLNSQNIILRIVLYIFAFVVFAITLIIDVVAFNTMDFWQGRVSAGSYEFKDADKIFLVRHEYLPGTQLRQSTIQVFNANREQLQVVVLKETASQEIDMYVDGVLRTHVRDIQSLPVVSMFNSKGELIGTETGLLGSLVAGR